MIKKIIILIIYILPLIPFAQDFSALWEGHFSYLNIKDTSQGNNKIYVASENAIFIYDTQTLEIEKLSTVNGLSGEFISTIHYSDTFELLIIGYENGLMEIAFDNDNNILTIVDIFDKPTIPPTDKKINHFNEYNGLVYISTDYGISVYDLERLEFGDTYFIGDQGSQLIVNQTVVFEEYIYAACLSNRGLRKALAASNNLINYQEWERVGFGNFLSVESNNGRLYTVKSNRRIFEVIGNTLNELFIYNNPPLDVKTVNSKLVITTKEAVYIYDENFVLISQIFANEEYDTDFTTATIDSEYAYIGTKDFGILKTEILNPFDFEVIHPGGPLSNNSFSVKAASNHLWVSFGDYTLTFNPGPLRSRGVSHLQDEEWTNIPYDSVLTAKNLNTIAINPFNLNQVFISSFQSGLLEINNNIPTILHDQTNSGLESLVTGNPNVVSIRVAASDFDEDGVLWTMTGRVERPLKSFNPSTGQWQGYSFNTLFSDPLRDEFGYGEIVIGNNGTKWIGGYNFGLIGYNTNTNELKSIKNETENMPTPFVTALALDKQNQVWLGTIKGLRVLYNTGNFFTDNNVRVHEIVILEDGVPKELLFQQFVSDIEVDGSNNKWVATIGAGVFYFSSDGQETIFHFTKENSPIPSNNVIDLSIDQTNGVVYIATDKGLVSFDSGGSATSEVLENAYVFPNPVRPTFNIVDEKVKIKGLSKNINIKIIDIEGNLVAEAESGTNLRYKGYNLEIDGGTAYWNGKNLANSVVTSGVYLVMLSDLETFETKVLKIMVVR